MQPLRDLVLLFMAQEKKYTHVCKLAKVLIPHCLTRDVDKTSFSFSKAQAASISPTKLQ
jgi:hypothetical protein